MNDVEMFENRLRKNARHWAKWAKRRGLTAFRLYDRDIPEFPLTVDWYDGRIHLVSYPRRAQRYGEQEDYVSAVAHVLDLPEERVFAKTHLPKKWGEEQYEREAGPASDRFVVEENGLKFWVNLGAYLDTGLFLDHRDTRARVRAEARGKRFLNLFAYTGSFTVYAAAGGAKETTTVDLSNTYLDWAEDNLRLNELATEAQLLVRADVLQWVEEERGRRKFDLIGLDPPSFSTSKAMTRTWNVQRDHPKLLADVLEMLAPGGTLYFSTNFLGFELKPGQLSRDWRFEELTPGSLPEDIRFKKIHRCWRITAP